MLTREREREVSEGKRSPVYFWYFTPRWITLQESSLFLLGTEVVKMINLNWMPTLALMQCTYEVLYMDCKEMTLYRHSLKSQLADTYYFRDIGSKPEMIYSNQTKSQVSCLLHCYDESWVKFHWIWWAQWVFFTAVQLKVVQLLLWVFLEEWGAEFQ